MNLQTLLPAIPTLLALGFVSALAAPAAASDKLLFSQEVDSCLAAVNSRLDLTGATRVRHLVSNVKRTGIGYALKIESEVMFSESEKRYEAQCVANGNNAPLKLRIEQT